MTARNTIDFVATIADMKENTYKNMLALTSLIDLLIEKGVISAQELADRARALDASGDE